MNPVSHIDPWMTILLPVMLYLVSHGQFTFGGAKPVPVTPRKFRHFVRGDILVSAAGVATNFLISLVAAVIFLALHYIAAQFPGAAGVLAILQRMMMFAVWFNLLLCFFNLIPIPPLDGSKLFYHLLPAELGARYRALDKFGYLFLFGLMLLAQPVLTFLLTPVRLGFGVFLRIAAPYGIGDAWNIFA
jgi:Zn-dependent protease